MNKNNLSCDVLKKKTSINHFLLIMRTAIFLLFTCVFISVAETGYTQNAKVTLNKKSVDLKEVLNEIENQTDYLFIYNNEVNTNKTVSVKTKNGTVRTVLSHVLKDSDIDFSMEGNHIILSYIEKQLNENQGKTETVQQQGKTITGTIVDVRGETIIGANIIEKGTSNGTITDFDGKFTLQVKDNAVLRISYIGYLEQEVTTEGKNSISVTLMEDNKTLDELVVVGYGVQKKANLSGAVGTVSPKQLKDRPVTNIGQALQGTIPNLNIDVVNGQSIANPTYNIRGTTSLSGGGNPLIVIDGMIADGGQLNRMNPSDIESVSVLKDAASSAIYGSRAAFGVILITTKSGDVEKLTINYNNNFSMKKTTREHELITDPYVVANIKNIAGAPWYHIYDVDLLAHAKLVSEDPSVSPFYLNPDGTYTYFGQTNWAKEIFRDRGFDTNHSIDFSGKTDNLTYYFSGAYNYNNGMLRWGSENYNRYNLLSKLDFKINDRWTISNKTSLMTSSYNAPSNLTIYLHRDAYMRSTLDVPRNPDGSYTASGANYLGLLKEGGNWKEYSTIIKTHFNTRYDILPKELFIQANFSYTDNSDNRKWHYLPVEYREGPEKEPLFVNEMSSAYADYSDSRQIQIDAYATYIKTFAEKHTITAIAGFNQEEYRYEWRSLDRNELISTSVPSLGLAIGNMDIGERITTWALRSGYGRLNYIFDDKYIIELNARYDGSSRFHKDSRFALNPSGSAAWVVSKESFFEPLQDFVSLLKPRISFGKLGNQDVSNYAYLATMGSGKINRILDGTQPMAVYAPGLVDGGLTWEDVSTLNFGLDLSFLRNKLELGMDIYERRTEGMLTKGQTLPAVLGTSVPRANAANLKTKGWELTLAWRDHFKLKGKQFSYNINFNLADNQAKITKFENPKGLLNDYYEGYKMGEVWGLTTLGFFTSQEDIDNHANQTPVTSYPGTRPIEPGDLKYEDRDGSGVIDKGAWTLDNHGDFHIIGNTSPRYTYGLTVSADWNGIDFNCFFQGVGKRDYFPYGYNQFFWGPYYSPWGNSSMGHYLDHWTEETPNAYFPRPKSYLSYVEGQDADIPLTRYKQDASYLRLKNLTVGYTLPSQIINKLSIDRLRVFFTGDNIFVRTRLYKYYKVDPENLTGQQYPLQKSYALGVNITF